VTARRFFICAILILLFANGASAARYQRTKDGKTIVWNSLRGVAQEVTWSGLRDLDGYATGEGTLAWYRLGSFINSYSGKMVRGKFEGPVIREQGQTRLQANFANGEKVSNWVAPGPAGTPSSTPSAQPTKTATEAPAVDLPKPSESPTSLPTPTPTPQATATPSPTPSPTSTATPTPVPSATLPLLRSVTTPSATPQQSAAQKFQLEETGQGPAQESLRLAAPPSSSRNALEEVPWTEPSPSAVARISPAASPSPRVSARTSPTPISKGVEAKHRVIAEFKQQTDSALASVAGATGNFRAIDDFAKVQGLPAAASAKVTLLTNQASEFRSKVGYETAIYECLAQIETVEALIIVDQFTRDLAAKDAPAARRKLSIFLQRYPRPSADTEKALWSYLNSALAVGDRAKDEAESRLKQARSLEAAGKKREALREYQEIYRIYPNRITADTIKALEKEH